MTDEKDKRIQKLEKKVEQLENHIRMPTRREALAAGGIGMAGLLGLSGSTSAASPSDVQGPVYFEQIGDQNNPVSSFYVDQEYQAASDQNPVFDSVTTGALEADKTTIGQVAAVAGLSTDQTGLSSNTTYQINLDSVVREDSDIFTVDLANNRITIDVSGTFIIKGNIRWESNSNWSTGDYIFTTVRKNGESLQQSDYNKAGTDNIGTFSSAIINTKSGDNITLHSRQDSGSDQSVTGSTTTTRLEVVRLG